MGNDASEPVVKVEKLSQRYGKAVALADVDLEIPANKMIGLIGPDGVGKSTLLGIIAGVRKMQGGKATVLGGNIDDAKFRTAVSYISPNAQFTPKTVETAEERHNLTFRVKLQIPDKEKLRAYERMVKVGTPGVGYVQLDPSAEWPKNLHLRPPSEWPKLPEIASGTTGSKQ